MRPVAIVVLAAALMAVATVLCPREAKADVRDDVLAQEARWLKAITSGDRETVESILNADFKHITAEGVLLDRAQEIATTVPQPFTMNPTDEIVDIAGDTAVIHGVNTLTQDGRVLATARFTDVFIFQNGTWMALSAQETSM